MNQEQLEAVLKSGRAAATLREELGDDASPELIAYAEALDEWFAAHEKLKSVMEQIGPDAPANNPAFISQMFASLNARVLVLERHIVMMERIR